MQVRMRDRDAAFAYWNALHWSRKADNRELGAGGTPQDASAPDKKPDNKGDILILSVDEIFYG